MKNKIFCVVTALVMLCGLMTACESEAVGEKEETLEETATVVEEQEVKPIKGEKYQIVFRVKQGHFTLSMKEHLKDSMNALEFPVLVDKDYFDAVEVGQQITKEFRVGSLLAHGSFGNWDVTVQSKDVLLFE